MLLALPLAAQGVYTNAAKPGDPICSRVKITQDPTLESRSVTDSNPASVFVYQQGHQVFAPDQRRDVSSFKAYDEKHKGVSIADLKGKIVIVGFWSQNCEPSAKMLMEMAGLEPNKDKFGFELLPVNFDGNDIDNTGNIDTGGGGVSSPGGWIAVGKFKARNHAIFEKYPLDIYLAGIGKEGPSIFMKTFDSMPAMFTIDPQGRLAAVDIGYTQSLVAQRLSMLIREGQAAKAAAK